MEAELLEKPKRAAIISVILERPQETQNIFNNLVSEYHEILRGRMGIPFKKGSVALIPLIVVADLDTINAFTGRLGMIDYVMVKASIASEDIELE
jgi:putative iron-only hydrogenase system regulator